VSIASSRAINSSRDNSAYFDIFADFEVEAEVNSPLHPNALQFRRMKRDSLIVNNVVIRRTGSGIGTGDFLKFRAEGSDK
jgi:nickel-dependent lactate racemase